MTTAGVAELKAHLSQYLDRVRAGEEVLVTDRGRPVARLVPAIPTMDDHLADLERRGLVRRGTGTLPDGFFDEPLPESSRSLTEALIEERREGR